MKDPQKLKVYRWEDSWWGWDKSLISQAECRHHIFGACAVFRVDSPKVLFHKGSEWSWSIPSDFIISMQIKNQLNIPISLHEATHHIVWHKRKTAQDHGPTFMGVYLWLLNHFKVARISALKASVSAYGITWRNLSPKTFK